MAHGDEARVVAAGHLFDDPPRVDATALLLLREGHHLLLAFEGDNPVGFVTGVEVLHADKGVEMYIDELGVAKTHRRRGIATQLLERLLQITAERGCYDAWTLTDEDNAAALATFRKAGATRPERAMMLTWNME